MDFLLVYPIYTIQGIEKQKIIEENLLLK